MYLESQSEARYNICIVVGRNEAFLKIFASMSKLGLGYIKSIKHTLIDNSINLGCVPNIGAPPLCKISRQKNFLP